MKKLFYICIHEVRYMTKNFNTKYQMKIKEDYFVDINDVFSHEFPNEKYFIHPDSLSIFESQDGDIGKAKREGEVFPYIMTRLHHKWWCAVGAYRGDQKDIKIIQRNNKPFIMPQSE